MKEFLLAALPWVVIGLAVGASCAIIFHTKKKTNIKDHSLDSLEIEESNSETDNYTSMGVSLGMCVGVAIGTALMPTLGIMALSYGICGGMLIGLIVGLNIKKK